MTRKTVPIEIDDENFVGSLVSRGKSPEELVEALLDHPIGSPKLEELVRGKKNLSLLSSDHTLSNSYCRGHVSIPARG
jgi:nickel-dependent lactate racemase